ncbi:MAG: transposase [Verrucomicrobiota bacterium]
MARQIRIEYEGAIYHVMNRGDRREDIFLDDRDRQDFLKTLGEVCQRAGWRVHAYCLMGNHFHLVIETPQPTLVAGMKWFLGTYTQRFNARHRMRGHLFSGRYKSLIVDGSENFYFRTVCDYVHLNPARAGLLQPEQTLSDYRWSSVPHYLAKPNKRPEWIETGRLLGELGLTEDNGRSRKEFSRLLEQRRNLGEDAEVIKNIRRGWKFGAADFVARLAEHFERSAKPESFNAKEQGEIMEVKARRMISEFLQAHGWDHSRLIAEPKLHPLKIQLAMELRKNTTQSIEWIAAELYAGSRGTLSNELSKQSICGTDP